MFHDFDLLNGVISRRVPQRGDSEGGRGSAGPLIALQSKARAPRPAGLAAQFRDGGAKGDGEATASTPMFRDATEKAGSPTAEARSSTGDVSFPAAEMNSSTGKAGSSMAEASFSTAETASSTAEVSSATEEMSFSIGKTSSSTEKIISSIEEMIFSVAPRPLSAWIINCPPDI
ncbi:MAG: hypothetical protein HY301_08990 [Verrucomicrobia bacterium]|nr:hypothetical protein [Verrucomicrobiota bacterium]